MAPATPRSNGASAEGKLAAEEGCGSVACNVAFRSAKERPFAEQKATFRHGMRTTTPY